MQKYNTMPFKSHIRKQYNTFFINTLKINPLDGQMKAPFETVQKLFIAQSKDKPNKKKVRILKSKTKGSVQTTTRKLCKSSNIRNKWQIRKPNTL